MVRLALWVSKPRRQALIAASQPVPPAVLINVLVDTGASGTCIDPSHLSRLGISPSGLIKVHTPTTAGNPIECKQFDVDIGVLLDNGNFHFVDTLPVLESELACQGIDGLLGRDVLSQGILIYNGAAKSYTLSF
jgi:hypothetical protein